MAQVSGIARSRSGFVPSTRTITAGAGLTGGGDLSANRTIALDPNLVVTTATIGTPAASAGDVRVTKTFALKALRNGGGGDISVLTIDGADGIVVGGAANAASVIGNVKTGGFHALQVNSVEIARWNATQQILTVPQIQWVAAAVAPNIGQVQATAGAGQLHSWYAQQGFAGSIGGITRIGGGAGGTPGTNLPGATQIDLGTAVSNVSALCSFLVGGASVLDISQSASGVSYIKSSARLQLSGTSLNIVDNALNPLISYNISTSNICLFKDIDFPSGASNFTIRKLPTGGVGVETAGTLALNGGQGRAVSSGANNDGGPLDLRPGAVGTGGSGGIGGKGRLLTGAAVQRFAWNDTGIGLFAAAPVAQPTRAGQITDNSGGTDGAGTIAALTGAVDPTAATLVTTRNAIATLAARLNLLEGKISAAGTGIGVTA